MHYFHSLIMYSIVPNVHSDIHFLGDKGDTTDAKTMEDTVDTFPFSFKSGRSPVYVYTIISYV